MLLGIADSALKGVKQLCRSVCFYREENLHAATGADIVNNICVIAGNDGNTRQGNLLHIFIVDTVITAAFAQNLIAKRRV